MLSLDGREWPSRVKYIIVDEVHNIGSADGQIWEQILILTDAPGDYIRVLRCCSYVFVQFRMWLSNM